jgi:hypothetical protein
VAVGSPVLHDTTIVASLRSSEIVVVQCPELHLSDDRSSLSLEGDRGC